MKTTPLAKLSLLCVCILLLISGQAVAEQQFAAPWGLDRIDQRGLPLDTLFEYDTNGAGVHVYIFGTGTDASNPEFAGRIAIGCTTSGPGGTESAECIDEPEPYDCHGYGTQVASIVGATTYGVANDVIIHPVSVFACDGSGSYPPVIKGLNWVKAQHNATGGPSVALLPFITRRNTAMNAAVAEMVAAGITVVVAAGNDNHDACDYSPASSPQALTVAATRIDDNRASFSNYGSCVDIFAPGVAIESAWPAGSNVVSSTGMAAAHVAGVAALYLGEFPGASPAVVEAQLISEATGSAVINPGSQSPNLLLSSRLITAAEFAEFQAMETLDVIETLPPSGFTTRGKGNALAKFLLQTIRDLQDGKVEQGFRKLQNAIERTDGCALRGSPDRRGYGPNPSTRDYVTNCVDQGVIYPMLLRAIEGPDQSVRY